MAKVKFDLKDNRAEVYQSLDNAIEIFLNEACGELQGQIVRNTRVDTGQLKASWQYVIEDNIGYVGSELENAIWEEFGTGIHAEVVDGYGTGVGRKGGWFYWDYDNGWKLRFTYGKKRNPKGLLYTFKSMRNKLMKRAEEIMQEEME